MQPLDVLKLCFEMSPEPLGVLDQSGAFAAVSSRFAALLGSDPQALVGLFPARFIDEKALPFFEDALRQSAKVDGVAENSFQCLRADGKRVFLSFKLRGCEGGLRTLSLCPLRADLRMEVAEFKSGLRALMSPAQFPIFELNMGGQVVAMNPAAERVFGLSAAELIGKSFFGCLVSEEQDTDNSALAVSLIELGYSFTRSKNRVADGSFRYFAWSLLLLRDDAGEPSGILILVHDITESTAVEREIKGRDRLLRAMLDNIQLFVMEVRADGTVARCEGKALAALGWSPEDIVGRSAFEVPVITEDVRTELRLALQGSVRQETIGLGGAVFDTWLIPSLNDAGAVSSVICVLADQTARVLSEREARKNLQTIERQRSALQAMALPALEVWDGVIAMPIIGSLDSQRAAELMEITLDRIVARSARFAILDLTGVETMDTATADHLIKVVQAAGLLGARALITGIRPNIAQILVHLGADLSRVVTLRTLREGLRYCADRDDEDDEVFDAAVDNAAERRDDGPIIP